MDIIILCYICFIAPSYTKYWNPPSPGFSITSLSLSPLTPSRATWLGHSGTMIRRVADKDSGPRFVNL